MSGRLLTVAEHSVRLGLDRRGQRLRRMLRDAQLRHPGQAIGVLRRRRWFLTEQELRRYLPALFGSGLDALEERVRAHLREVDQRIDRRAEAVCLPLVAREREDREAADIQIMASVVDVAKRVGRLAEEVSELKAREGTSDTSPEPAKKPGLGRNHATSFPPAPHAVGSRSVP